MPARLVALDEGSDIPLDRAMVVVGRHPLCDVRLDSLRISRHHCCMTQDKDELVVRDLGSTNGIRINGERVERGRLRTGDELSIAHIRYRLENEFAQDLTIADPNAPALYEVRSPVVVGSFPSPERALMDKPLGEVVRGALGGMPDKCRIQVIVQMKNDTDSDQELAEDSS
jgi:FHA domain